MAIKLPDLVQHNNPLIPIADSDNVCGGTRSAVATVGDLYTISTNLLKQNATRIWVTAASKFYTLTNIADAGNSAGWTADAVSVSSVTGTLAVVNGGTGQTSYTNGQLLIGNTTGSTLTKSTLTAGTGITITNGAGSIEIAATGGGGGSGTVTSVTLATTLSGLSVTGTNPITTSGTLTIGGTLGASSGGTGQSTYTIGNILYASTSSALTKLAPNNSTTRMMLTQTGFGASSDAPKWESLDAILPSQTGNIGKVLGTNGATTSWVTVSGAGDVVGPASSTTNGIATFSSTSGKALSSNTVTLSGNSFSNVFDINATNGYFGTSGTGVLIGYNGVTASGGSAFMLTGSSSGLISIVPGAAAAGTYTWKLPTSFPVSANQFLKTTGSTGETGWASLPAAEYLYRLTNDESNYITAGLTLVTGFAHSMAASTKYRVDGVLIVNQASATPNFRMAFDAPGTASTLNIFATNFNEGAGAQRLTIVNADNTGFVIQQPGGLNYIIVSGFIVTGSLSGSVNFYGGQGTGSSGNPTTLKAGSFLTYTEVL